MVTMIDNVMSAAARTCLAAAVLAAAACTNPFADSDTHEHADGLRIEFEGTPLVTLHEGEVTGSLSVAAGESVGPLNVVFTDHHGDPMDPDAGYWMRALMPETVAAFEQTSAGAFSGTLVGFSAGETTLTIELVHGSVGHGHTDFRSVPIPVVVTE